ncbi:MAG: hypothetical protein AB8B50_18980 [Pirellulaceae bacterium]
MLERSGNGVLAIRCGTKFTEETASDSGSKCDNRLTLSGFLEEIPMPALLFRGKTLLQACGNHELQASIIR